MMSVSFKENKIKGVVKAGEIQKLGLIEASKIGGVIIADLDFEIGDL
jgi:hypothetical protein